MDVSNYFRSKNERILTVTAYAKRDYANNAWWLRTITDSRNGGGKTSRAASVYSDGSFATEDSPGVVVTADATMVRPVLWVTFDDIH